MLNEIGEYEHYTFSPEQIAACKNHRLKHHTLIKNDFGGLERAMTIIARHFIFDEFVGSNEDELCEILKAWCGFEHKAKTPLPENFNGWLDSYIRRVLLFENVKAIRDKISLLENEKLQSDFRPILENILFNKAFDVIKAIGEIRLLKFTHKNELKKITSNKDELAQMLNVLERLVELPNKNRTFSRSPFGASNANGENYFREITYDKVFANALLLGKLRRYYLACDEELFKTKKIFKADKHDKELSKKDKDIILKMTAEYLLQRRDTTQEFVVTNNADMTNWLLGSLKSDRLSEKRKVYMLATTEENLFKISKIEGIGVTKIRLAPEWTKHFHLIEDESDEKWGQIFFSDSGLSEPLRENVLYQ